MSAEPVACGAPASADAQGAVRLDDDLYRLRIPTYFDDGDVNVFAFVDGDEVDLIDCGTGGAEAVRLLENGLCTVARRGYRIRRVVATHGHRDHYGAAAHLARAYGCEILLHRLDLPLVHSRFQPTEAHVREVVHYMERHGADLESVAATTADLRATFTPREVVDPTVLLDGAEILQVGRRLMRVHWTPGHTAGHVCLFDLDSGTLFAGDHLLQDITPNVGLLPGSTGNPLDEFLATFATLRALEPVLVMPGHGDAYENVQLRLAELDEHHSARKERFVSLLRDAGEVPAWALAMEVWGHQRTAYGDLLALQEGLAHLQALAVEGRVQKWLRGSVVTWDARDGEATR